MQMPFGAKACANVVGVGFPKWIARPFVNDTGIGDGKRSPRHRWIGVRVWRRNRAHSAAVRPGTPVGSRVRMFARGGGPLLHACGATAVQRENDQHHAPPTMGNCRRQHPARGETHCSVGARSRRRQREHKAIVAKPYRCCKQSDTFDSTNAPGRFTAASRRRCLNPLSARRLTTITRAWCGGLAAHSSLAGWWSSSSSSGVCGGCSAADPRPSRPSSAQRTRGP